MSKELTPLKALNDLIDYLESEHLDLSKEDHVVERKEIIETALEDYELMKQAKIIVADKKINDDDLEKLKNQSIIVGNLEQSKIEPLFDEETQKKLKALEIIKKYICIKDNKIYTKEWELTQEKYELLKEVLL